MNVRFLTILIAVLFVNKAVAGGPEMLPTEFKTPEPGTKLQYKNLSTDLTFTITATEPDGVNQYSWVAQSGDKRSVYPFCRWCLDPTNEIEYEKYVSLFPIEKGKKVKFQRKKTDKSHSWTITIKVKKTELLKTPISSEPVATYVIVEKIRSNSSNNAWTRTFWWSPEYGANLKVKDHARNDGKKVTLEMINYSPSE